jgi:hypothetical protein
MSPASHSFIEAGYTAIVGGVFADRPGRDGLDTRPELAGRPVSRKEACHGK